MSTEKLILFISVASGAVAIGIAMALRKKSQQSSQPKVITIEPTIIKGTVDKKNGKQEKKLLVVSFIIKADSWEKAFFGKGDVEKSVEENASKVIPEGKGIPDIEVADFDDGFFVYAQWTDSTSKPNESKVASKIEAIDGRLKGRIKDVKVIRADY